MTYRLEKAPANGLIRGELVASPLVPTMQSVKEFSQPTQKLVAPAGNTCIGLFGEETNVADPVRAKLDRGAAIGHVLVVSREVVAPDHAAKGFTQHGPKDLATPRGIDVEHRETRGTETPSPMTLPGVLVPRLVNTQSILRGESVGNSS